MNFKGNIKTYRWVCKFYSLWQIPHILHLHLAFQWPFMLQQAAGTVFWNYKENVTNELNKKIIIIILYVIYMFVCTVYNNVTYYL